MTTQLDISQSNQIHKLPAENKPFLWTLLLIIIVSLAIIGYTVSVLAPASLASSLTSPGLEAWSGRYQGLADQAAMMEADNQWLAAVSARYALMAEDYAKGDAYAARYQGMADRFALIGISEHGQTAWAARYQDMARFYAPVYASTARYQGMADRYYLPTISQQALDAWAARYQVMFKQFDTR